MLAKPVAGEVRDLFQRPRFFEKMACSRNDFQPLGDVQTSIRLAIEADYRNIVAADYQESRCLHVG